MNFPAMRLWKMWYKCLIDTCSQNRYDVGSSKLAVKTGLPSVIFEKVVISIESKAALGRKWWAWQARRIVPTIFCPATARNANANANVIWPLQTTGSIGPNTRLQAAAFLHPVNSSPVVTYCILNDLYNCMTPTTSTSTTKLTHHHD
jgi:hypothetical protein